MMKDRRKCKWRRCAQRLFRLETGAQAGGPLCLDLTKPEELADPEDPDTWSLVWFEHEDFDRGTQYRGEDGLLHGQPAAPNLQTLLEWYFCRSLEAEFEEETGIHVTYEWLNEDD